jgi:hypothetical protein
MLTAGGGSGIRRMGLLTTGISLFRWHSPTQSPTSPRSRIHSAVQSGHRPGCIERAVATTRAAASMRVEHRLILTDLLANRSRLRRCGIIGVSCRWKSAELHQTGHQQHPSLGRGQVRAADEEEVVRRNKTLGLATLAAAALWAFERLFPLAATAY